jgi:hypothetical protein
MKKLIFALSDVFCDSIEGNYGNINQAELLGYLCTNRIIGIAFKNMHKCSVRRQKECKDVLETMFEKNVQKSKVFKNFVCEIASILEKAEFNYVLLKGAYLSTALYEEGMRTSNDIDILVQEKDIKKCQYLLETSGFIQGYIEEGKKIRPASRREIIMSRMNYGETVPFVKEINGEILEIDINFSLDFKPEQGVSRVKQLLEKREQVIFENSTYYTLNQYDFLIHLCCHLYKEATTINWVQMGRDLQLYKFSDINLFFRKILVSLDIDTLVKRIKEYQTEEECYYTIINASKIYPQIIELDFYNYLIQGIKPDNLEFMKQIVNPETGEKYSYDMDFEDWFFVEDKIKFLK